MKPFVLGILMGTISFATTSEAQQRNTIMFGRQYQFGAGWIDPFFVCFPGPGYCFSNVLIYTRSVDGLRGVQFSAPIPDCLGQEPLAVEFNTPHTVVEGDLASGITIEFDSCLTSDRTGLGYITSDIYVGSILIITTEDFGCCAYFPWPVPGAHRLMGIDCSSNDVVMYQQGTIWNHVWDGACGAPSVPFGEFPLNGSSVPPGTVMLDWDTGHPAGTNLGEFRQILRFGTDPTNLNRIGDIVWQRVEIGPLAPATTYYWQVSVSVDFGGVTGPIWSFTTEAATPTEPSTWGKAKARAVER